MSSSTKAVEGGRARHAAADCITRTRDGRARLDHRHYTAPLTPTGGDGVVERVFGFLIFPKKKKGGVGVVFTSRVRSLEHNATVKLCGTTPRTSHVRNNTRERVENPTKELRAEPPGDDGVLIFFNSAELTTCSTVETRRT